MIRYDNTSIAPLANERFNRNSRLFTLDLISDYVAYLKDYFAVIIFCDIAVSPAPDLKGVNS